MSRRAWLAPLGWLLLLLAAVFWMDQLEGGFRALAPGARLVIYQRDSFPHLLANHLAIVAAASLLARAWAWRRGFW